MLNFGWFALEQEEIVELCCVSFQVQCGLIVVAYKDGSPAHPHFMDEELCSKYWAKWLLRLEEYTEKQKNQSIPKPD